MKIIPTSIVKVNAFLYPNKKLFNIFLKWLIRKRGVVLRKFQLVKLNI